MNNIDQYLDAEASKSLNKIKVEMDNIKENNKLIAEFMGFRWIEKAQWFKPTDEYNSFQASFFKHELKFHKSWDWLMPVVEKIMDLDKMEKGVGFKISGGEIFVGIMNPNRIGYKIAIHHSNFDGINDVWNACIKFIKWYNEDK